MFQNHHRNNTEISHSHSKTDHHHPTLPSSQKHSPYTPHLLHAKEHKRSPAPLYPSTFFHPHCLSDYPRTPFFMPFASSSQCSRFRNLQQRSYPSNNALQPFSIPLPLSRAYPSLQYRPCQKRSTAFLKLGKQTSTTAVSKTSMKSKLFGNTHPRIHAPQQAPSMHKTSGISTPLFLPSSFSSISLLPIPPLPKEGHRLPEAWQADINAAVSEGLSESQAHLASQEV